MGRGLATLINTTVSITSSIISKKSIEETILSAATTAVSTLSTSPVNGWFKSSPNTFDSAVTKGTAEFVAGVHVEGMATTGRVVYEGITSTYQNTNTTVNRSIKAVIVGGSGKFTSKMMKW